MLKYKRIAMMHWQLLQKHMVAKRQRMAGTLLFMYKKRLTEGFATLEHAYGRKESLQKVRNIQHARHLYNIALEQRAQDIRE